MSISSKFADWFIHSKYFAWYLKHERTIDFVLELLFWVTALVAFFVLVFYIYTERSDKLHFALYIWHLVLLVITATLMVEERLRIHRNYQ